MMRELRTADPKLYKEIQDAYEDPKANRRLKGHFLAAVAATVEAGKTPSNVGLLAASEKG